MILSICIANKGRTHYLKEVLPLSIEAANMSPPIEFVIVNYDSPDDLDEYIKTVPDMLKNGNYLTYVKVEDKPNFHMAHARNVAIKSSTGDYVIISGTEIGFKPEFFPYIREKLNTGLTYLNPARWGALIVCERNLAIEMGGFDERFEMYGPEDKDFCARVYRRGIPFNKYPVELSWCLRQTMEERYRHYRLRSYKHISKIMHDIYDENNANNVLVVNEGIEWGKI